ncbi:MAG: SIR2 family protein [Candidatus Entotheonellia bacterium]
MGAEHLPLLKPHGCISQPNHMSMSSEDIYQTRLSRRLIFTHIEMLHLLGPVIYIGYSLKDVHILDMICDLTKRLGVYRKPILFVTLQEHQERMEKERIWFERRLEGEYLACGFEGFMDELPQHLTPAVGASSLIRQLSPCRATAFASNGSASHKILMNSDDESECWLSYIIAATRIGCGVPKPLDTSDVWSAWPIRCGT